MKKIMILSLVCLPFVTACDHTPANTDPRQGIVWTAQNKTAWKQCDGTTMLYGKAERGAPYGKWVTATQPNAQECM